jgi:hypothetical protein
MKFVFPGLGLLGAVLAIACEDNRPVYPLGELEVAGASGEGQGGAAGAQPETSQNVGGAGGRTADAD